MPAIEAQTKPTTGSRYLIARMCSVEEWIDKVAPLLAGIILAAFFAWCWWASRGVRLQFDELLEISAALASSARELLAMLAAGVDFNPPLTHFLVRGSAALLGPTEWAVRLPSVLGFVVFLGCLYAYVAKRLNGASGLVAILTILCTPVRNYAFEARPYGEMLGFSALAVLLFAYAAEAKNRYWALPGLALCTAGMVASHYYAALVVGVLFGAELIRSWGAKRISWSILFAIAVPPAAVLAWLLPAIKQQRTVLTHYFARGNLLSFKHGYDDLAIDPLACCLALLLIAGVPSLRLSGAERNSSERALPPLPEWILAVALLLLPIFGAVITQFVTHAYVPRYFLPASIGLAICFCFLLRRISSVIPALTLLTIVSLGVGFAKAAMQVAPHSGEPLPSLQALNAEATPLLFDSPGTYAQAYFYFPNLRHNMWAITDPAASLHYRQYDTDDRIMLALAEHHRAQTISLKEATRRWSQFRLIPRSGDYVWALKCLMETGSTIQAKQPYGDSNFIFSVQVDPASLARLDACSAQ